MVALGGDLVVSSDFPSHLAGLFVEGREPRFALMHPSHDDMLASQNWRGAVIPVQGVFAIGLDQVGLP